MVRAFVAIELHSKLQVAIKQLQDRLQSQFERAPIRWVPVENIHLTLKFLGDIREGQIESILEVVGRVAQDIPVFRLTAEEVGCFPSHRRARVIWLGIKADDDRLDTLHAMIEQSLSELGFEPERRRFKPHLTLGRVKKNATSHEIVSLGEQLSRIDVGPIGAMDADCVYLMRSQLKPSGAIYTRLGSATLKGAA